MTLWIRRLRKSQRRTVESAPAVTNRFLSGHTSIAVTASEWALKWSGSASLSGVEHGHCLVFVRGQQDSTGWGSRPSSYRIFGKKVSDSLPAGPLASYRTNSLSRVAVEYEFTMNEVAVRAFKLPNSPRSLFSNSSSPR